LNQRFPTGKGYTTTGITVKIGIRADLGHNGFNTDLSAIKGKGIGITRVNTSAAGDASFPVKHFFTRRICFMGFQRTVRKAGATGDTFIRIRSKFRVRTDGFGIVAPDASERAALEKYGRPDTRPVMDGKSLDIKNKARYVCSHKVLD
jgi:hypothetical protein